MKLKGIHGEAQRDFVKLLDDKVREMEGDIGKFKAAVSAAAPSDSAAPLALRLGSVEGSLAALVARAGISTPAWAQRLPAPLPPRLPAARTVPIRWPVGMTHGRDSQRVNEATTTNNDNHNSSHGSTTSAVRENHDHHHNS